MGCFLKPHFAPLPFLLLACVSRPAHSRSALLAVEVKVLLAAGLINAVVVLRYFPDWLVCAQWVADLYHAYTRAAPKNVLLQPFVVSYSWPALLLLAMFTCSPWLRPITGPFLLVAGYGLVTFVLQGKGWSYQFLPVAIMLYIALGLALIRCFPSPQLSSLRKAALYGALSIATLLLLLQLIFTVRDLPQRRFLQHSPLAQALSIARPDDRIYAFTTTVVPVFPTVLLMDLQWASRFASLWPLAGLEATRRQSPAESATLAHVYAQLLIEMVTQDFSRYKPTIVLVDRRDGQFGLPPNYDFLAFSLLHERFSELWRSYHRIGTSTDYDVYIRTRPPTR